MQVLADRRVAGDHAGGGRAVRARRSGTIVAVVRTGQPAVGRSDQPGRRWVTLVKETLGHTRMLQWTHVGIAHWFVFVGFGFLFFTLVTAFGQLFDAEFALPLIGHWVVYEWATDLITWLMLVSILGLILIRRDPPPAEARWAATAGSPGRGCGRRYFVEAVILGIGLCILDSARRGVRARQAAPTPTRVDLPADVLHRRRPRRDGRGRRWRTSIYLVAMVKIVISFTWMIVLVAQHHDGRGLAPVHRLAEHLVQARGRRRPGARRAAADDGRRQADRLREHRRPRRGHRRSASARSRTSPGRACSTSPRAPSAGAASRSARRGTPRSRCRRSCW